MINLLDNQTTQPSRFRTTNWVEINNQSNTAFGTNSQTKFKCTMLKSSLCDYSDAYILINRTATISGVGADTAARQADERNREVIFEN